MNSTGGALFELDDARYALRVLAHRRESIALEEAQLARHRDADDDDDGRNANALNRIESSN